MCMWGQITVHVGFVVKVCSPGLRYACAQLALLPTPPALLLRRSGLLRPRGTYATRPPCEGVPQTPPAYPQPLLHPFSACLQSGTGPSCAPSSLFTPHPAPPLCLQSGAGPSVRMRPAALSVGNDFLVIFGGWSQSSATVYSSPVPSPVYASYPSPSPSYPSAYPSPSPPYPPPLPKRRRQWRRARRPSQPPAG